MRGGEHLPGNLLVAAEFCAVTTVTITKLCYRFALISASHQNYALGFRHTQSFPVHLQALFILIAGQQLRSIVVFSGATLIEIKPV